MHLFSTTPSGGTVDGFGHYHDTYEKVDGSWRLSTLRLEWLHHEVSDPRPAPGADPAG